MIGGKRRNSESILSMWSWSDEFFCFGFNFFCRVVLTGVSHPRGTNYCVCDGERTHTHLLHAHFSGVHALRVHFAHSCACYTHAWFKGVCSAHVVISLSHSRSPFSCVTRPCSCCSLKVTARPLPTTTSLTLTSMMSCRALPT